MTHTVEFLVTGEDTINCAACEQRISNALRRLPGVQDVQASAQTQRISVHFDPAQVGAEQIQARLDHIGYQVISPGEHK